MMHDLPSDPITELMAGAMQLHELYIAYVAAGFSDDQAYGLVRVLLVEAIRNQQ